MSAKRSQGCDWKGCGAATIFDIRTYIIGKSCEMSSKGRFCKKHIPNVLAALRVAVQRIA